MRDITKAVKIAIDIAKDNSHGYDQENREGPDYDCSSFIAHCLHEAGFNVATDSWTGNLYNQLTANGFKEVHTDLRVLGDIFLTPQHHVIMCIDDKSIVHASGNEKGRTTGGKTGDQTGKEICVRSFYTPSYGWAYHLRYLPPENQEEYEHSYYAPKLIEDIIAGKYGVYPERAEKIKAMGLDYDTVQYLVNRTIKENA